MKDYFSLQYKLINRKIIENGINPNLAYVLITIIFISLSITLFKKLKFAEYIYILFPLHIVLHLAEKRRTDFLKICFGDSQYKKIRLFENLICSAPFILFLLYKTKFLMALIIITISVVFGILSINKNFNYTVYTPFSKHPFEFAVGFRKTYLLIFAAYSISVIAIKVNNFNLGLFCSLMIIATTLGYYGKIENEYYVWNFKLKPNQFLFYKIKIAIVYSAILVLPIIVALSFFYVQKIGFIIAALFIGWIFLAATIIGKYSAYPKEISILNGFLLAVSFVFPPLLIVIIPYFFTKSKNQLNTILK